MDFNSNFNNYPSFNEYNNSHTYRNNNNNNQNQNSQSEKYYKIKETINEFYIKNNKINKSIKISKINRVQNESKDAINIYQADSIIGIFDINDKKYLGLVTESKVSAKLLNNFIFRILKVKLIKMTNKTETMSDTKIKEEIENIFLTKNFYYSNEYDLSLSLYDQNLINSYDFDGNNNNKKKLESKYLINSNHLKYFVENNIPESFYSTIIFGYIGCKLDVNLDDINNNKVDIILIERYYKKDIIINRDIPGYFKQIEFICNFRNKNKMNDNMNVYSFVFYVSSKTMKNVNDFRPLNNFISEEFEKYKNITCIINNINNYNQNFSLKQSILNINQNFLGNKIKLIDFTESWDKGLYFDTNNDSYNIINFYKNQSIDIIQKNIFWFIDINNYFSGDDCCFNAFIRILWKAIQKEINFLQINIDIGLFDKSNSNYICNKFKEIIMKYHNDLDENKKSLYHNQKRDDIQFNLNNYIINNDINLNLNKNKTFNINKKQNDTNLNYNYTYDDKKNKNDNINIPKNINMNTQNINSNKIKIMCITWNIAGIPHNIDYNITKLFTENIFYYKNEPPDIIVVGIQEIIKLSITSILSIVSNQENVITWTSNIINTINKVFKTVEYYELKCLDLVGIYLLVLIKKSLRKNISLIDSNTTKTGVYGTMGNKGFFTLTIKCFDTLISFGSGHFEAGQSKNEDRIDTLIQLLNKTVNINEVEYSFKDIDIWIILGDLNFRIDLSYEDAISLIKEKKYDVLYSLDQFNTSKEKNYFLKEYIREREINFEPTYKYVKGSNEYAYDEDKIRVPAWTDRIFYCKNKNIKMLTYDTIKSIRYSDHRPVVGTFLVNCVNKKNENNGRIYNDNNNNFNNNRNNFIYAEKQNIKEIKNVNYNNNINRDNANNKKNNNIQNKKINNEKIKMNYRGIDFNTEIEINKDNYNRNNSQNREKQNIYDFFQDKRANKQNTNNLIFDPFNYQ